MLSLILTAISTLWGLGLKPSAPRTGTVGTGGPEQCSGSVIAAVTHFGHSNTWAAVAGSPMLHQV